MYTYILYVCVYICSIFKLITAKEWDQAARTDVGASPSDLKNCIYVKVHVCVYIFFIYVYRRFIYICIHFIFIFKLATPKERAKTDLGASSDPAPPQVAFH